MTSAILLCAGFGTRLEGLGGGCPKPLLPMCDVPILEYGISKLVSYGITNIVINLHNKPEVFKDRIGDGSRLGASVSYSTEAQILGTGGGLKRALPLLDPMDSDEPFLSLNGKLIFDLDLGTVLDTFKKTPEALGLMVVRPSPEAEAWGAVDVQEGPNPRVKNILGPGRFMFGGVHVTRPSVVRRLPDGEACMVRQGYLPWIQNGENVAAFIEGKGVYFAEHSTQSRYLDGNLALLDEPLSYSPLPTVGIDERAQISPDSKIIEPVCIRADAVVEAGAAVGPHVVLGKGARIGRDVSVNRSVLWRNSTLENSGERLIVTPFETVQA